MNYIDVGMTIFCFFILIGPLSFSVFFISNLMTRDGLDVKCILAIGAMMDMLITIAIFMGVHLK